MKQQLAGDLPADQKRDLIAQIEAFIQERDRLFTHVPGVQTDDRARAQFIKDLCEAAKRIAQLEAEYEQARNAAGEADMAWRTARSQRDAF